MAVVNKLSTLALLLLTTPVLAGGADVSPSAFELTLKREACYGFCPTYSVKINGNGAVDWTGERWVKQTGKASAMVNPDVVQRLKQAVQSVNFFALKDEYTAMDVSDLPYASLEIRQGTHHKIVRWYLGDRSTPPALLNLAKQVDLELGTAAWIGKR